MNQQNLRSDIGFFFSLNYPVWILFLIIAFFITVTIREPAEEKDAIIVALDDLPKVGGPGDYVTIDGGEKSLLKMTYFAVMTNTRTGRTYKMLDVPAAECRRGSHYIIGSDANLGW
jgi:hypothetical protein